ncbi:MAG: phenylalanine--tRNA ligase subunit beta [Candidatus Anammoxibacter sp.]
MKASYNWIKDFCNVDLSVEDLADKLTSTGLVVEEISQIGNDYCLDMEVTANRPDCLGIIGIARELRAITGCELQTTPPTTNGKGITKENHKDTDINVNVINKELCPRYTAQIIRNVQIGPSPAWLQDRLTTIGIRPINNVVDITNYVLIETGQPLHAFDLDKLNGSEIVIRTANAGEKIVAIDGTNQTLLPDMLVIADNKNPVAIAGIMGGSETEVSDSTKNILLECARFEPTNIRKTSKKLGLSSDSSFRFERGVDPEGILQASERAADLIKEVAGGDIVNTIDKNFETPDEKSVRLNIENPNKLLGIKIEKTEIKSILEKLGFTITSEEAKTIDVKVPSYRSDVYREIDLIEEIIRIYGYDKIPIKTEISLGDGIVNKGQYEQVTDRARQLLTNLGLFEVVTFSIVEKIIPRFDVKVWSELDNLILKNPLIQTEDRLRKTLLFNFLKIKKHNQNKGVKEVNIFEISNVYLPVNGKKMPDEKKCLSLLVNKGFSELKGIIESIIHILRVNGRYELSHQSLNFFDNEESAIIKIDNEPIGFIGKLSKELCDVYELNEIPCFAEIDFDLLVSRSTTANSYKALPNFPEITRDVAIVVDEKIKWGDVEKCITSEEASFFDRTEFFDIYRGKQIAAGKKSIAFSVIFRADDRTLKGEEADNAIKTIVDKLNKDLDAKIREL